MLGSECVKIFEKNIFPAELTEVKSLNSCVLLNKKLRIELTIQYLLSFLLVGFFHGNISLNSQLHV